MSQTRSHIRPRRRTFIREWREHRGLSQEQAAERLGMSQPTLSKIERGIHPYNQDFLETAAAAYGCEPADLLIRNPQDPATAWSLSDDLKGAPPELQDQVRVVVRALLKRP